MGGVSLSLLVLKTRQVDRLRRFYGTLGIDLVEEQHGRGPVHFAGRVGEVVLEVYPLPEQGHEADTTTRLGFTVARLAEVVAALEGIGTCITTTPQATEWGYRAVVRDPDGRAVELSQLPPV
jgi:lactoylglutathione lyase